MRSRRGPYDPCGAWAEALWPHPDAPDEIAYPSRHDPSQISLALFSHRPVLSLVAAPSMPVGDQAPFVAHFLAGYGKSVTDLPA